MEQRFYTGVPASISAFPELSKEEIDYYNILANKIDPGHTDRIEGKASAEFFKHSGLSVSVLKKIWSLSTPNNERFLDRPRLFWFFKYVALAQAGLELTPENIGRVSTLPNFQMNPFSITEEEVASYHRQYYTLTENTEIMSNAQAKDVFLQTGLPGKKLKKIWDLVSDGHGFNKMQFAVAMHILLKVKNNGFDIPKNIPGCLASLLFKRSASIGYSGIIEQISKSLENEYAELDNLVNANNELEKFCEMFENSHILQLKRDTVNIDKEFEEIKEETAKLAQLFESNTEEIDDIQQLIAAEKEKNNELETKRKTLQSEIDKYSSMIAEADNTNNQLQSKIEAVIENSNQDVEKLKSLKDSCKEVLLQIQAQEQHKLEASMKSFEVPRSSRRGDNTLRSEISLVSCSDSSSINSANFDFEFQEDLISDHIMFEDLQFED